MEKDLTEGGIFARLIRFSVPFFFSYFLQTLYGLADLFIIGRFCGTASTSAVSLGSQVMHMATVMIVGLCMGISVHVARSCGAGDSEKIHRYIGNSIVLFVAASAVLSVVLLLVLDPVICVLSTPEEAVKETASYLRICFAGVPCIVFFNVFSSIFRGTGDSKSPLVLVIIACAINIALDYLFIGYFELGATGAAFATVLAQFGSVVFSFVLFRFGKSSGGKFRLSARDFVPDSNTVLDILKLGLPISLQDGFIQVSFLIITVIVNRRGLTDAAAVGIVEKIIGILFLVPSSMLSSVSTVASHNFGAKKIGRARKTLFYGVLVCVCWGISVSILMMFDAESAVGFFTKDEKVIAMGADYMRGYVWDSIFAGIHFCFSGYFCACSKSVLSFVHNIIAIAAARIPLAYLASSMFADRLYPMGIATALGSFLSVIICVIFYLAFCRFKSVNINQEAL